MKTIRIISTVIFTLISLINLQAIDSRPLKLFYSQKRTDNFTTATLKGSKSATAAGYRYAGIEGHVLTKPQKGTKALKLFYNPIRKDNFITATTEGERVAIAGGYRFVRIEGYVYSSPGKGRKPLKLFYNPKREDNFTTSSAKGLQNAKLGGYRFARVEGYVLDKPIAQNTGGGNSGNSSTTNIPGRYNLPESFRPAFENMPVWRLQLKVTTAGVKNADTDDEVFVKMNNYSKSVFYLDRAGDDREKNNVNTYDIIDPSINTIKDIKMLRMSIKGDDGWCVQKVELLVNNVHVPVFKKQFQSCKWLDNGTGKNPTLFISGTELRKYGGWKFHPRNKAIWLPPTIIKRADLEQMVESYVGHMMNAQPSMSQLEFGKKYGRAYVEAKKASGNTLHFDLDLAYKTTVDLETDVDFDLVVKCQNNQLSLKAQSVNAELNVPIVSSIIRIFKSDFAKMKMAPIDFGNASVPFCPSIKVLANGDISIRP